MTMCWNENTGAVDEFVDNKLAAYGVETLKNVSAAQKETGTAFFVAVGLHRPHLPWDVPVAYYDLYGSTNITLADHNQPPLNYNITGAQQWSWDPQSGSVTTLPPFLYHTMCSGTLVGCVVPVYITLNGPHALALHQCRLGDSQQIYFMLTCPTLTTHLSLKATALRAFEAIRRKLFRVRFWCCSSAPARTNQAAFVLSLSCSSAVF